MNLFRLLFLLILLTNVVPAAKSETLTIQHEPAPWAIKGQSLTLRAKVSGGSGGVENVTLFYSLFRDAAPFRVSMASSGMGMYVGTIESGLLSGVASISYYIEAEDAEGSIVETDWYDVTFRNPTPSSTASGVKVVPSQPGGSAAPTQAVPPEKDGLSATTIGLIAGGALAIGAGAYALSDSDSGGGGGSTSPGDDPGAAAGTYRGILTVCEKTGSDDERCSSRNVSILIDSDGQVFSDNMVPNTSLNSTLSGNRFSFSAPVSDPVTDLSGTQNFNGRVVDNNSIVGSVSGSYVVGGTNGTYSGTFSLNK